MLWSAYAPETRTSLWFRHGCFGQRMLLEHERYYGFGRGCFGQRMLLEHERYYGSGMDALVSVCSGNVNVIVAWAWMLFFSVCSRNTNVIMV